MKKVSVVIPCYNEEENISDSYSLLKNIIETIEGYEFEIIFADNDSTDNSEKIFRDLAQKDKRVKVILNNRNFGPECSTMNALLSSSGDAVILVMADRQDPYELIPEFIKKWEDGEKVVWGQKIASKESKLMYMVRSLYYKIIKNLSDIKQYKHVIGYGLYDNSVIEEFRKIKDHNPILRNIIPTLGYKPFLIQYKQNIREKGQTTYNFFKYFDTAMNSLIHTSKAPMKMMIYTGGIFSVISLFIGICYTIFKLTHWTTFSAGIAPLILIVTFFVSMQMLFLGIIGEYLMAVLDRVSFTKYVVEKERINFEE